MSNTYLLLIPILICVLGAILSSVLFKNDEKKNDEIVRSSSFCLESLEWRKGKDLFLLFFLFRMEKKGLCS